MDSERAPVWWHTSDTSRCPRFASPECWITPGLANSTSHKTELGFSAYDRSRRTLQALTALVLQLAMHFMFQVPPGRHRRRVVAREKCPNLVDDERGSLGHLATLHLVLCSGHRRGAYVQNAEKTVLPSGRSPGLLGTYETGCKRDTITLIPPRPWLVYIVPSTSGPIASAVSLARAGDEMIARLAALLGVERRVNQRADSR